MSASSETQPLLTSRKKSGARHSTASNSVRSAIAASLIVGCVVAVVAVSGNSFFNNTNDDASSSSSSIQSQLTTVTTDGGDVVAKTGKSHTHTVVHHAATAAAAAHDVHGSGKAGSKKASAAAAEKSASTRAHAGGKKSGSSAAAKASKVAASASAASEQREFSAAFAAKVRGVDAKAKANRGVDQKLVDRAMRDLKPLVEVARVGQDDAAADEETPAAADEETPAADEETPAAADEETPAAADEETPAAADEETPAAADEETPASADADAADAAIADAAAPGPSVDDLLETLDADADVPDNIVKALSKESEMQADEIEALKKKVGDLTEAKEDLEEKVADTADSSKPAPTDKDKGDDEDKDEDDAAPGPGGAKTEEKDYDEVDAAVVVPITVTLGGYTKASFGTTEQTAFKAGVATAASVAADKITITAVTDAAAARRRLLAGAVAVDFEIQAAEAAAAEAAGAALKSTDLKASLVTAGLADAESTSVVVKEVIDKKKAVAPAAAEVPAQAPNPSEVAYFTDEVFRADIATGMSDAVMNQIMLQKAIDRQRPLHDLKVARFSFFVGFDVTIAGMANDDCQHITPGMVEAYVADASKAQGHPVPPALEHVSECRDLPDKKSMQFHVKVYIPRKTASTNPTAESKDVLSLFTTAPFQKHFNASVDGKIQVLTVKTTRVVVHGEIMVRMPPVDGTEKRFPKAPGAAATPGAAVPAVPDVPAVPGMVDVPTSA